MGDEVLGKAELICIACWVPSSAHCCTMRCWADLKCGCRDYSSLCYSAREAIVYIV